MLSVFNLPIVDILNSGFGGFCFLIAFLAYLLLVNEQKKESPRREILGSIKFFIIVSLVFGVLVLISVVVNAFIGKSNINTTRAAISEYSSSLHPSVRSENPDEARQKIQTALVKLDELQNIPELRKKVTSLQSKSDSLEAEVKSMNQNFLVKVANIVRRMPEFGLSINPLYPCSQEKIKVNTHIQDLLAELNYYDGPIDGDCRQTSEALIRYQTDGGFTQTGYFSAPTAMKMIEDHMRTAVQLE